MKLREAAGLYEKQASYLDVLKQLKQTANIIYCEYFIFSLWKDKSAWKKKFGLPAPVVAHSRSSGKT